MDGIIMVNKTINGDDLIVSEDDLPSILIVTCYLSILSGVGTLGNAFVLYVFSRKKDKNTSTIFILALASVDFMTCIVVMPFTIVMEFQFKKIDSDIACKIYLFLITSNVPFSAFIMTVIAIDRYVCICRPWVKWLDIKCAKIIILALLLFSLVLGLVTSLAYGVYHVRGVANRQTPLPANVVLNNTLEKQRLACNFTDGRIYTNVNRSLKIRDDNNTLLCGQSQRFAVSDMPSPTVISVNDFVFTGFCYPNEIIIGSEFRKMYQQFYASLFLIAFIVVFSLYALIYRSIHARRSRKYQTTSTCRSSNGRNLTLSTSTATRTAISPDTMSSSVCVDTMYVPGSTSNYERSPDLSRKLMVVHAPENDANIGTNGVQESMFSKETNEHLKTYVAFNSNVREHGHYKTSYTNRLTVPVVTRNNKCKHVRIGSSITDSPSICSDTETNDTTELTTNEQHESIRLTSYNIYRKDTRKSIREKHRLANIKTAGILFIVTLVFVIAFLPAWLMATKLMPPNMIIFYTYFIYNVANPVIYAFFNQTFQKEMKIALKCSDFSIPFW